ncbi:MAG: hypothetical protein QE263_04390 [Vampirovibrionales bacterium]|nr:hypothetical protein [Vampirovibrionales bacterium]
MNKLLTLPLAALILLSPVTSSVSHSKDKFSTSDYLSNVLNLLGNDNYRYEFKPANQSFTSFYADVRTSALVISDNRKTKHATEFSNHFSGTFEDDQLKSVSFDRGTDSNGSETVMCDASGTIFVNGQKQEGLSDTYGKQWFKAFKKLHNEGMWAKEPV